MFKHKDAVIVPTVDSSLKMIKDAEMDLGAVELNLDAAIKADQAEIERLTQKVETARYQVEEVRQLRSGIADSLALFAA